MFCELSIHIYLYHQFTGINRNRNVVGYKENETFLAVLAAVRHPYGAILYDLVDCCREPVYWHICHSKTYSISISGITWTDTTNRAAFRWEHEAAFEDMDGNDTGTGGAFKPHTRHSSMY